MTSSASPSSAPRFEIVDDRHAPRKRKRRSSWGITVLLGAVRGVIEGGYVSLAKGVMVRAEDLEDARAARNHASRSRKAERRRRRESRAPSAAAS